MAAARPILTAIGSGKGGTGKTFIAATLAQAFAQERERVLLFDADLGLSNIAVQLGLGQCAQFSSVLTGECAAGEAAVAVRGGVGQRGGFDVLAGPPGSGALANVDAPTVLRTIAALRLAAGYDRVILDLGAGVEDMVMRFASAADEVVTVLTSDPSSLTDAYAFIKLFTRRMPGRAAAFIVNQVANGAEARHTADALISSCRSFLDVAPQNLGFVRRDPKVIEAIRRQTGLLVFSPHCTAANDIIALARRIQALRPPLQSSVHAASLR